MVLGAVPETSVTQNRNPYFILQIELNVRCMPMVKVQLLQKMDWLIYIGSCGKGFVFLSVEFLCPNGFGRFKGRRSMGQSRRCLSLGILQRHSHQTKHGQGMLNTCLVWRCSLLVVRQKSKWLWYSSRPWSDVNQGWDYVNRWHPVTIGRFGVIKDKPSMCLWRRTL